MQPPGLRSLARTVIARTLICNPEDCMQRRYLIDLIRLTEGNCLSEDVLLLIIEKFPKQLTDELLCLLVPNHIRYINVKECCHITCEGLINTMTRCSHLNRLDLTGCNRLLHPTVFCCLKDFAPHITTLLFDDCEVMTDDCVKIILMCCPALEHLNVSSCKNITDEAFALSSSSPNNKPSAQAQEAGKRLSSVDISGCQSLTSIAVRNIVTLCGHSLTSVNIAWTGIGCIGLLYLSGLSRQAVIHFVQHADPRCLKLLESDAQQESEDATNNGDAFPVIDLESYKVQWTSDDKVSTLLHCGEGMAQTGENVDLKHGELLSCNSALRVIKENEEHIGSGHSDPSSQSASNFIDDPTSTEEKYSLDDEWVLACQQMDQLCKNSDVFSEHIWKNEQVSVDSVSAEFKDGISCLTSAFINLDSIDDNEDDSLHEKNLCSEDSEEMNNGKANLLLSKCSHLQNYDYKSHQPSVDEDEDALNNAGESFMSIFSVEDGTSENLSSPLDKFGDALISLTAAMEDLMNNDEADDNSDDNNHDNDGSRDCHDGSENESFNNDLVNQQSTMNYADKNDDESIKKDFANFQAKAVDSSKEEVFKIDGLNPLSSEQINLVVLPEVDRVDRLTEQLMSDGRLDTRVDDIHPPDDKPLGHSTPRTTKFKLTHKPQLRTIDISNIYFHSKALGVACLKMFTAMNKSLHSFTTSWTELDDDTFISLIKSEQELCSLTLIDCEKITDKSLEALPIHCPQLKKIDLKGVPFITDSGVIPMLVSPVLQSLSLAEASITDLSMFAMTEQCADKLQDLDLSWCEDLTDKGMSTMVASCTGLRTLALRQCAASFATIEMLSSCCGLISLNIAGIDQLTDQMLGALAKNLPHLSLIDISWNSSITSVGVCAFMSNCNKLREANLSGLKSLTSKPFLPIISDLFTWRSKQEVMLRRKFKRQQHGGPVETFLRPCSVEIAKCLGDDLPFRSTTYCSELRSLVLEYSDKVNDDHLAQIVAVCRGTLTVIDYYSQPIEPKWIFFDWTKI